MIRMGLLSLLLPLLYCLLPQAIEASCCSSSTTCGVGRLLAHERALVELSMRSSYRYGAFDERARFRAGYDPHQPHVIIEPEMQVMFRVTRFLEPFLLLPARIQVSEQRAGANIADLSMGVRSNLVKGNEFLWFPGIAIMGSVRVPSGVRFNRAVDMDAEDITSDGNFLIAFGLLLEKEFHGITYGLGYGIAMNPIIFWSDVLRRGPIHSLWLNMGMPIFDRGHLTFFLSPIFHGGISAMGKPLADSDRRKVSLGFGYAHRVHSHLTVNAQAGCDLPIPGKNFGSEMFFRLGLRFGVY